MKKPNFISIICLLVVVLQSTVTAAQTIPIISKNIILKWQREDIVNVLDEGKQSVLSFENAHYDFSNTILPYFFETIALPASTDSISISITNDEYQPLSAVELGIIKSYSNKRKDAIINFLKINSYISYHKKKPIATILLIPIRINPLSGEYEKIKSFTLQIYPVVVYNKELIQSNSRTASYATNSILANGSWHKIALTSDGIYKIDYPFLKKMGMNPDSINPKNIRLYGNGGGQLPFANIDFHHDDLQENAIYVHGETDGRFDSTDYVLFYGQDQTRWNYLKNDNSFHHHKNIYSDTTYYFISYNIGFGKRISNQSSSSISNPTHIVSQFNDYQYHELDKLNLLESGREWFGEVFDIVTNYSFNFNFPNISLSSKSKARITVAARRDTPGTDFSWNIDNNSSSFNVREVPTSSIYGTYYNTATDTISFSPASELLNLSVYKTSPSPAIGWLNYLEINARRDLTMHDNQIFFRDINSVGIGNVSQFNLSNITPSIKVWDVTDKLNVKLQEINHSGSSASFILATDTLKEFIAFNGQSFLTPKYMGGVPNQDLHGLPQIDYIIVTHPSFLSQAKSLANLHSTKDGLKTTVATIEEVYNEFSSGAQDVSAIRNFMKMFYDRAKDSTELPRYLLLFGRGSYNLKNVVNNTNYIPTYESLNSADPTYTYPSDDFFAMLDDNEGNWDFTYDVPDMGVGRLPVVSVSEANVVLEKINKYVSVPQSIETGNSCSQDICYGLGDWTSTITFCADDEDGSLHLDQAEGIASRIENTHDITTPTDSLHDIYNIDKIYFDAFQQFSTPGGERYPDATTALNKRIEKGSLIINYTGHGGSKGLGHEHFLEISDINGWKNQCKFPLLFTATCEFSRWDNPDRISAGELTLLSPSGGSIGLLSTSRVVYSGPNAMLNNNFYNYCFQPMKNGSMPRLGDLHMLTKISMPPNDINHRNFTLLGDPALMLNYPEYIVETTSLNGKVINPLIADTVSALSRVSVSGEIRDKSGNLVPTFNGIIYPTVYDKPHAITTLSNDGSNSPKRTFNLQKNILFKGKASVVNGKFDFEFIIPKDIAYNYDNGKISYYAHNGYEDASGFFNNIIIGGTDLNAVEDMAGPEIKLFINDEKFAFGGITDSEPKIFATVKDSNGINTAGSSIGHDITAVLDNNTKAPFVLNDYYESDLNNYKKGSVRYPLNKLTEGKHTLSFKVWDVYNNSSTAYTEFIVASSQEIALKHVLNYPNPFTTKTAFYFEHNQCCTNMEVQIQIFTVSGKLVKTIHKNTTMEGYRSEPIEWDGTDDYKDKIGKGVYIYRLRVKAGKSVAEQYEKLVILK